MASAKTNRASAARPRRTEVPELTDVRFEHAERSGAMWMVLPKRKGGQGKRVWLSAAEYAGLPKAIREPNKPVAKTVTAA